MSSIRTQFAQARQAALSRIEARERERARKLSNWRTQRHRRALVLVLSLGILLLLSGAFVGHLDALWWYFSLTLTGLLTAGASWYLLRILTGRVSGSSPHALLDERERQLRYRATYAGFQVMGLVLVFAMIFQLLIDKVGGEDQSVGMLATLLLVGLASPTLVLGWTLPTDYPEEAGW